MAFIALRYRLMWARARFAFSLSLERHSGSAARGAPACAAHNVNTRTKSTAFRSFIADTPSCSGQIAGAQSGSGRLRWQSNRAWISGIDADDTSGAARTSRDGNRARLARAGAGVASGPYTGIG